jgi:hypothetical protein
MIDQQKIKSINLTIMFLILLVYGVERYLFIQSAKTTTGDIVEINSTNRHLECRKSDFHACTQFMAKVQFLDLSGNQRYTNVRLNSVSGLDQPISLSEKRVGQKVEVIFSPTNSSKAYENRWQAIWLHMSVIYWLILTPISLMIFLKIWSQRFLAKVD